MTKLNKSLEKELDGVFHAYLLFSNSSRELIKQAKKFAGLIAFNDESIDAHPDIKIVESDNLRTLGVEDIRTVITQDNLSPIEGRYKVVIFPPLKSLTEEASNALLKTIEEPSKTSVFLILSTGNFWSHSRDDSNNMILSTIKSRCRTIFVDTDKDIKFNYSNEDFIDFLDCYVDTFLSDLVKLKQDLHHLWAVQNQNVYTIRTHQIYQYIWDKLEVRYESYMTDGFHILDVMNSLRIEPYLTSDSQRVILEGIVKSTELYAISYCSDGGTINQIS